MKINLIKKLAIMVLFGLGAAVFAGSAKADSTVYGWDRARGIGAVTTDTGVYKALSEATKEVTEEGGALTQWTGVNLHGYSALILSPGKFGFAQGKTTEQHASPPA